MEVHLMLALFLVQHHRVSAFDYLYAEMEHLNGSCFPRDSCVPPRPEEQDHLWGNHTCECGAHCVRYGTCCANSAHVGEVLLTEHRGERCQKLSAAFPQPVKAVSRCPHRWRRGFKVRERCEGPADVAGDPMSALHVTSLATHVTYKNHFCATCNYDDRDLRMWDVELAFEARESVPSLSNVTKDFLLENIFFDDGARAWGIVASDGAFHKVKFKFKVPAFVQKYVKKCFPNAVSRCGPSFSDNLDLQFKCASYYAPIRLRESESGRRPKIFRNVHCALCSGVNVTRSDSDACKLDVDGRKKLFSLTHLIDVNRSDGEMAGKRRVVCGQGEKWDPFFKKCRSLACAVPGHVVRNGQCVQT